jgi:hypothetical protein
MSKRHQPSFGQVSQEDLRELARVSRRTLRALYDRLSDPDFNYIIHSAPIEDENKNYYLWHIQILPRLATIAGFELGSGICLRKGATVLPKISVSRRCGAMLANVQRYRMSRYSTGFRSGRTISHNYCSGSIAIQKSSPICSPNGTRRSRRWWHP